ncbi:hypothetical protein DL89DRAFT_40186 [Linderina pennispora]|uniref:C2H2-type domain-containing protein n=1 Tax=Linderina pennispora TaxID=61395 RepID=A0A1Y1W3I5_9FUNG|nr:uncharacterized protein DL89DRAFT_40186 [Linderina pennispora]ORX68027.1 hypothetical protein DL89DRAFT_40186 [Linderina pennispora]
MTDDIPTTSKPIRDNYGIRGRHAHGRFGCRDCGEIFQTSLKLYRHRVSHLPVVRIKFLGKVVIEFQKHADNRVECLCGKDITIVNMISVHKYHCQACMEEARRRLDQKPESKIPSNEHGQQPANPCREINRETRTIK